MALHRPWELARNVESQNLHLYPGFSGDSDVCSNMRTTGLVRGQEMFSRKGQTVHIIGFRATGSCCNDSTLPS